MIPLSAGLSGVWPRRKKGVSKDPPTHSNLSPSCDLLKIKKPHVRLFFPDIVKKTALCSVYFLLDLQRSPVRGSILGAVCGGEGDTTTYETIRVLCRRKLRGGAKFSKGQFSGYKKGGPRTIGAWIPGVVWDMPSQEIWYINSNTPQGSWPRLRWLNFGGGQDGMFRRFPEGGNCPLGVYGASASLRGDANITKGSVGEVASRPRRIREPAFYSKSPGT